MYFKCHQRVFLSSYCTIEICAATIVIIKREFRLDEPFHKNVFDVVLAYSNYIREKGNMGKNKQGSEEIVMLLR